jgi:hypothetical protein
MLKYQEKMKEYELTFESPVLDPAFVSKAKDFETKLAANQFTEEEIAAQDIELLELLNSTCDFQTIESEEVIEMRRKETIATAKAAIAEAETLEALANIGLAYKDFPEVMTILDTKVEKLKALALKQKNDHDAHMNELKRKQAIETGTKEINAAKYEDLQALGEKYKDYPELVTLVNDRHSKEKPVKDDEELKKKLLAKAEFNYTALRAMGITPTGNDMTVAGVRLEKEFLLEVYRVRRP